LVAASSPLADRHGDVQGVWAAIDSAEFVCIGRGGIDVRHDDAQDGGDLAARARVQLICCMSLPTRI
jgi:hypothetical protein